MEMTIVMIITSEWLYLPWTHSDATRDEGFEVVVVMKVLVCQETEFKYLLYLVTLRAFAED
jgi:hypothetical protein